ncbi:MAG: glycosyltransferase family 4 protein, partial [Bacteriovoracaceae bacterium]|nr:glycosyltransferase family 4 protein [Bacteriovoracaceae bacterium]
MKIVLVSQTNMSGVGHTTRLLQFARHFQSVFGSDNLDWICIVPGRGIPILKCLSLRKIFKKEFPNAHFIPMISPSIFGILYNFISQLTLFVYLFFRYFKKKDLIFWSELTQSAWPILIYQRWRRAPLFVNIHGTADEIIQFRKRSGRSERLYKLDVLREERVLANSDGLIYVSERMKTIFEDRYHLSHIQSSVIPCCVDNKKFNWNEALRDQTRAALGWSDRFVFIYAGGTSEWQCVDEILGLYAELTQLPESKSIKPLLYFMTWSASFKEIQLKSKKLGLNENQFKLMTARQSEVGRYLRAADSGFILRRAVTTNQVSCPTKAGEYLLSGLP